MNIHVKRAIINGIVEIEWKMCVRVAFMTKEGNKCNFLFEYQQTIIDKHGGKIVNVIVAFLFARK